MKRFGNLYNQIVNYDNLLLAHKKAQKGKRKYNDVINVNNNQKYYIDYLYNILLLNKFKTSKYISFTKHGPKKDRVIHKLPYYPDRIVHHAIMNICEPIWYKTLIRDTYSSIKGRGVHDGFRRMKLFFTR